MRIGIFGGTFDPPHLGHLILAQDVVDALSLDQLQVVPAAQQPLKHGVRTPATDRLAMVQRTFRGLPSIAVDPIEIDRGGLSYMVDTVGAYRDRWPSAELFLVVGADILPTFPQWHAVARLCSMAQVVVLDRVATEGMHGEVVQLQEGGSVPVRRIASRRIELSSTEVRARVRDGRSIRGFVVDAVAEYIASNGLYRWAPDGEAQA